jgi:hypothetical protein
MDGRWITKTEGCKLLGISVPTFERAVAPLLPPEAKRLQAGTMCGRLEFLEPVVVQVRQQQLADAATAKALRKRAAAESRIAAEDEDPLMAGGGRSAALEEYRKWRAKSEQLNYERSAGSLVPSDDVRLLLARTAARLRQAGQELQRLYGADAQAILDAAIDDITRMPCGAEKKE